jgi:hypothetical protein
MSAMQLPRSSRRRGYRNWTPPHARSYLPFAIGFTLVDTPPVAARSLAF